MFLKPYFFYSSFFNSSAKDERREKDTRKSKIAHQSSHMMIIKKYSKLVLLFYFWSYTHTHTHKHTHTLVCIKWGNNRPFFDCLRQNCFQFSCLFLSLSFKQNILRSGFMFSNLAIIDAHSNIIKRKQQINVANEIKI